MEVVSHERFQCESRPASGTASPRRTYGDLGARHDETPIGARVLAIEIVLCLLDPELWMALLERLVEGLDEPTSWERRGL